MESTSEYDLAPTLALALEVRKFTCPKCNSVATHYVMKRYDNLRVSCDTCELNYFWNWQTESFGELGMAEQEFGEPDFILED